MDQEDYQQVVNKLEKFDEEESLKGIDGVFFVTKMGQQFLFLNERGKLIRLQATAIPDFRSEMDTILKGAVPDFDKDQLERLKDFFIQN